MGEEVTYNLEGAVIRVTVSKMYSGRHLVWLEICGADGVPVVSTHETCEEGGIAEFDVEHLALKVIVND